MLTRVLVVQPLFSILTEEAGEPAHSEPKVCGETAVMSEYADAPVGARWRVRRRGPSARMARSYLPCSPDCNSCCRTRLSRP